MLCARLGSAAALQHPKLARRRLPLGLEHIVLQLHASRRVRQALKVRLRLFEHAVRVQEALVQRRDGAAARAARLVAA